MTLLANSCRGYVLIISTGGYTPCLWALATVVLTLSHLISYVGGCVVLELIYKTVEEFDESFK